MLAEDDCLCANEKVLTLLPFKMREKILKRGLSRTIRDYAIVLVAANFSYTRW